MIEPDLLAGRIKANVGFAAICGKFAGCGA
jgi:hypothetical protein